MRRSQFDGNPPRKDRITQGIGIVGIVETIFEELRMIVLDMIVFLTPIFTGLPWLFLLGVGIAILLLLSYALTPLAFVLVQYGYTAIILYLNVTAAYLNFSATYITVVAPIWNPIATILYDLAIIMIQLFCPGVPYTGESSHDCPILFSLYVLIQTQWDYWWAFAQLGWQLLGQLWTAIALALCPGSCSIDLCRLLIGVDFCVFNIEFAIRLTIKVIFDLVVIYLYSALIMIYFLVDVVQTLTSRLSFLLTALPPGLSTLIINTLTSLGVSGGGLINLNVPLMMESEKQLFLTFETIVSIIASILANVLTTVIGLIDGILCNFFKEPIQCFGAKVCYLLFWDINFWVDFWIGAIRIRFPVYIPFRTFTCFDTIKINPYACAAKCDYCAIQPFGVPIYPHPFYTYANAVHKPSEPNALFAYVPCIIGGTCCNPAYSIVQHAL